MSLSHGRDPYRRRSERRAEQSSRGASSSIALRLWASVLLRGELMCAWCNSPLERGTHSIDHVNGVGSDHRMGAPELYDDDRHEAVSVEAVGDECGNAGEAMDEHLAEMRIAK